MRCSVSRALADDCRRAIKRSLLPRCLVLACLLAWPLAAHADWQAAETVKSYVIAGTTGPALYESIGERGPKDASGRRAIAHTNFSLTWTRQYEVRGVSCVLVSAQPKLTITYVLPKPAARLPAGMQGSWERFIAGVNAHERVHGDMIKDMVREIETATVGLAVADDPQCQKIRAEMTRRLAVISAAHRQRNRDFDRVELSNGGNVHQLILALVNGQ